MPTVSGFGSGFAFAKETTYGTPVATAKAMPFINESLTLDRAVVTANTLVGGNYLPTTGSSRLGSRRGGGDIQTYLYTHGTAALTEAMLGGIATTGAGPYIHTATVAATLPSYTLAVTFGATAATLRKTVEGAKVASWEIALASNENATLGTTWVYQDELLATSSALVGTYPASASVYYADDFGTLTIGGVAYCVTGLTVSGDNGLAVSDPCIGQTVMDNPPAQRRTITGSITIKLDPAVTTLYTTWQAGTVAALIATATQGASLFTIQGNLFLLGSTPVVSGEEELTVDIPFEVRAAPGAGGDAGAFKLITTNSDATP